MKITGVESNIFILEELGRRIKDARIAISMTQKEMALKAGISEKTVERIEKGENVKIENLLNIFRVLNFLQNFEILIPEQEVLIEEMMDKKKRKRASRKKEAMNNSDWKWGEE